MEETQIQLSLQEITTKICENRGKRDVQLSAIRKLWFSDDHKKFISSLPEVSFLFF